MKVFFFALMGIVLAIASAVPLTWAQLGILGVFACVLGYAAGSVSRGED